MRGVRILPERPVIPRGPAAPWQKVMLSAVSESSCWSKRGRSPFHSKPRRTGQRAHRLFQSPDLRPGVDWAMKSASPHG